MTTATPSMPTSVADCDLFVLGMPLDAQLPPGWSRVNGVPCRASDTCPTYGGEMCPDDQALVDKCQHF